MAEIRHLGSWRQDAKIRFSEKLTNSELWSLFTTYRKSYMGFLKNPLFIWPLKSKMAEIHHLENQHEVIFSAEGGPNWIKFCRLVQNDMSTAVIWSKSKPRRIPIWWTFGRIQWHVIPEPPGTLQGAATWWINCHDSRAECHITKCHIVTWQNHCTV